LYEDNQLWLNKKHILGRIRGFLPYIGIITILLNDYPMLKWVILGMMGIMVLTSKDPQDT
jgi:signal peptidase